LKEPKPKLLLNWATHEAAAYACKNWHYSKCVPTGKLVKVGVWEDDAFIGVVIFSRGASPFLGAKFELPQVSICELTRIAMNRHKTPVSRIVAIAVLFLKKHCPGVKLVVSFADPKEGHHGGVYQAGNWVYSGRSNPTTELFVGGKWRHMRGAHYQKTEKTKSRVVPGKHRYLMPICESIEGKIRSLKLPYPKRAVSIENDAAPHQGAEGGVNPTTALHFDTIESA